MWVRKKSVAGRLLIAIGRRGRIGNKDPQTTRQANTRANTIKIIAQMEINLFTLCLHISSDLRMLTGFYKCVDNTFVIVGSHHRLEVLTTMTTSAALGRYIAPSKLCNTQTLHTVQTNKLQICRQRC